LADAKTDVVVFFLLTTANGQDYCGEKRSPGAGGMSAIARLYAEGLRFGWGCCAAFFFGRDKLI